MLDQLIASSLNRVLRHQTWANERLSKHAGKHCLIISPPLRLGLQITSHGQFENAPTIPLPDVCITLPSAGVLRWPSKSHSIFTGVRIEGCINLAEDLGFVLRNMEFDIEGELATVIGDIPARRLSQAGRLGWSNFQQAARRTAENIQEHAILENGQLISLGEFSVFMRRVGDLRDDLARLDKRIARL